MKTDVKIRVIERRANSHSMFIQPVFSYMELICHGIHSHYSGTHRPFTMVLSTVSKDKQLYTSAHNPYPSSASESIPTLTAKHETKNR